MKPPSLTWGRITENRTPSLFAWSLCASKRRVGML
jgi:hypothetical protein